MEFGRGLVPTVAGPVEAVEDELDGARVERRDRAVLEAGQVAAGPVVRESGGDGPQMGEHAPEQALRHLRVASAVGVGERVAVRALGTPQPTPLRFVHARGVADAVERLRSGQMLVDQGDKMAHRREFPRHNLSLRRGRLDEFQRNQVDEFTNDGVY